MSGGKRGWLARLMGGGGPAPDRIIHLCAGPNCCRPEVGNAAYEHLARRLKDLKTDAGHEAAGCVKALCFNVCGEGPVAVVMPDRVWYSGMSPGRLDRVIDEHLLQGRAVSEFSFEPPIEARTP